MPFVKIDCGILDSTVWLDPNLSRMFFTALFLAVPMASDEPLPQIEIGGNEPTGWMVPAGRYGFVGASVPALIERSKLARDVGIDTLRALGAPEPDSRSPEFDGRRLIKVPRGFMVLNYARFRDKDYTNAERQARWRKNNRRDHARMVDKIRARRA